MPIVTGTRCYRRDVVGHTGLSVVWRSDQRTVAATGAAAVGPGAAAVGPGAETRGGDPGR